VSPRKPPLVAGVIGGVGSGKSAVSRGLSRYFQVCIIDADRIGHEVLTFPAVKTRVRQSFGDEVFNGEEIDRRALAQRVFGETPRHQESRARLEKIVHPEIRRQLQIRLDQLDDSIDVVVLDAALMLEAGWNELCDIVVFIDASFEERLARVQKHRDWSADELRRREASQKSLENKRAAADFVVNNDGRLDDAVQQFCTIVQNLIDPTPA